MQALTPMQFIEGIAKMRTFAEVQTERVAIDPDITPADLEEICCSSNKDDDWLMNDSADLEQLILEAREILKNNPKE